MTKDPVFDSDPQYDETGEAVCGGVSPDTWCGTCPDCRDAADDWRELNGDDA